MFQAFAGLAASALSGGGGSAGPSSAAPVSPFDSSGWSVAFGNARAGAAGGAASSSGMGGDQAAQYLPWLALGLAAVVAYRMLRKK